MRLIALDGTCAEIAQMLDRLAPQITGETVMAALDDLEREVAENNDAIASATTLLQGLKAKLDEAIASGSMAKVQALSQQLSGQTDALAQAVAANTPAEEPAAGEPVAENPTPTA